VRSRFRCVNVRCVHARRMHLEAVNMCSEGCSSTQPNAADVGNALISPRLRPKFTAVQQRMGKRDSGYKLPFPSDMC
jgi:hypothetical protein